MLPPEEQIERTEQAAQEVDLREIWRLFLRRRRVVLLATIAVFVAAGVITYMQTPIYKAESIIQVESDSPERNLFDADGGAARFNRFNTVMAEKQIILSRSTAEEVVRRLGLDHTITSSVGELSPAVRVSKGVADHGSHSYFVEFLDEQGAIKVYDLATGDEIGLGKTGEPFSANEFSFTITEENPAPKTGFEVRFHDFQDVVAGLRGGLAAEEVAEETNIIRIMAFNADPDLARAIVNMAATVYLERNVERKSLEASQTLDFITSQIGVIKQALDTSESEIDRFKTERGIVMLDQESSQLVNSVAQYEVKRAELNMKKRQLETLAGQLRSTAGDDRMVFSSGSLDDDVLRGLVQRYVELRLAEREAATQFGESHPQIVSLTSQIEDIRAQALSAIDNSRRVTGNEIASLDEVIASYDERIRVLPDAERQLTRLMRTSRVNQEIYTFLLTKHEEARIAKAATVANIRIIDPAIVPDTPVKPRVAMNLAGGLLLGLLLGIALAILRDHLDDTIKSIEEVERNTSLSVIGTIPKAGARASKRLEGAGYRPILVTRLASHNPFTEAYRALCTNTQFIGLDRGIKTILFTSALEQEGKSTIAANLAITTARIGMKTLIVDCDLRRPVLHKIFGIRQERGVSEILDGTLEVPDVVQHLDIDNLHAITSGEPPSNPSELLVKGRMQTLLASLREEYDLVIVDSPPVIVVTDPAILSTMVDGVYIAVRSGRTPLAALRRAQDILGIVRSKLQGVVLNDIAREHGALYGYYNYYHYYSSYSYYTSDGEDRELGLFDKAASKVKGLLKS